MNYRELLDYVKSHPGCIQTLNQKKQDSEEKYSKWVERQNRRYEADIAKRHASR